MSSGIRILRAEHDNAMKKKKTNTDGFVEWQHHQYDPGHYTGSNTHPFIKADGNPICVSIWFFIQAGILAFFYFLAVIQTIRGKIFGVWTGRLLSQSESILFWSLFLCPLALFSAWIGIRYFQKAKRKKAESTRMVRVHKNKRR